MGASSNRVPNTACTICGTKVYRRPSELENRHGRAYCSSTCYGISCRQEKPCAVCGKPILASLRKKTCGRSCANRQRRGIGYGLGSPNDKVLLLHALKSQLVQQRGATCERCGYAQVTILQVHHRDRNRANNGIENLELVCPNCHCEEHYLKG
jgi:hypothetical protein